MKGSVTKDPEIERAHQEKHVLELQKLLINMNFNYMRSKDNKNSVTRIQALH